MVVSAFFMLFGVFLFLLLFSFFGSFLVMVVTFQILALDIFCFFTLNDVFLFVFKLFLNAKLSIVDGANKLAVLGVGGADRLNSLAFTNFSRING